MLFLILLSLCVLASTHPRDDIPNYLRVDDRPRRVFTDEEKENFRLNDDTWPSLYKVRINAFNHPEESYTGDVEIEFTAQNAVQEIVLNQQGITLQEFHLFEIDAEEIPLTGCVLDNDYEKIICTVQQGQLDTTKLYKIHFKYTGTVHGDMRGFYESYYKDTKGARKTLGTTHFGQQGRRLLPCWDEPRFKAKFEISVRRNKNLYTNSVTNGKFSKTEEDPEDEDYEIDYHETTSRIPAYILALIVSDFEKNGGEEFSIYARPNAIEQTKFALSILPKIVEAFDHWTKIPYFEFEDVEKMDMAAIPDFSAGAMENWGLLIHREVSLLADPGYTTTAQYQSISRTTSHEVAHQWFGDLVTCDWWEATWLNEGFATYFADVGLDYVWPNWDIFDQFVVDTFQNALAADATTSTHPLTRPGLYNYPDIRTMFSTITYSKGGSVLRMMHNLMGDSFQRGIQTYLTENSYATAKPEDLFRALQDQEPEMPITELMKAFSEQPGFPLITATRQGGKITLTQKRFFIEGEHEDDTKWILPITVATSPLEFEDTTSRLSFFPSSAETFEIEIPNSEFYVLNVRSFNFYRVNYDTENWLAIRAALNSKDYGGIHKSNRAQIIDDLFQLARAGHLKYDFILDILEDYMKTEVEHEPWAALLNGLNYLQIRIPDDDYRNHFQRFVHDLLEPIYNILANVDRVNQPSKLLWLRISDWACKFGVQDCINTATELFRTVALDGEIEADQKQTALCTGLRVSRNNWSYLWKKYVKTNYATEEGILMTALGCTRHAFEINAYLNAILSDDIRPQDKSAAYSRVYTGNLENVDIVLEYITTNHEEWAKVMSLGATLSDLASRFTRDSQVEKLQNFIDDTSSLPESTKQTLRNAVERANKNIEWDRARLPELLTFFQRNERGAATSVYANVTLLVTILSAFVIRVFN